MQKQALPKLFKEHKRFLKALIIVMGISEVMQKENTPDSRLAPDPDGLLAEYYMAMENIILLLYKNVIDTITEDEILLDSWKEATISLIHKEETKRNF